MAYEVEINDALGQQFLKAFEITGETTDMVLDRVIRSYCAEVFMREAQRLHGLNQRRVPNETPE